MSAFIPVGIPITALYVYTIPGQIQIMLKEKNCMALTFKEGLIAANSMMFSCFVGTYGAENTNKQCQHPQISE